MRLESMGARRSLPTLTAILCVGQSAIQRPYVMRFASSRCQYTCFLQLLLLSFALSSWSAAAAQTGVQPETSAKGSLANDVARSADPGLLKEVNEIQAIDNHSHPPSLTPNGEKDDDYDSLPCDPLEPTDAGLMFREDNPVYIK